MKNEATYASEEISTSLTLVTPLATDVNDNEKTADDDDGSWSGKRDEKPCNKSSITMIFVINFANFVNGIYMSVPGPTLLFLAERVSCGVGEVSSVLVGRSAGNLLGAFAATLLSRSRSKCWDTTMRLGLSLIVFGCSTIAIPFVNSLWSLITVLSIGGFLFGLTNTGFIAVQLEIFGEKRSRPLMQLFQAVFSAGAMCAPLITSPFLKMAAAGHYNKPNIPSCFRGNDTTDTFLSNVSLDVYEEMDSEKVSPVTWVYVITGALHLLSALTMVVMSFSGVEDKARCGNKEVCETREEEPLCRVMSVIVCVIAFYAFQIGSVTVFASYIYSVSYCSRLEFSITKASSLNSLYWGLFIVGRVLASFVSSKVRPSTLITGCVITLLTSAALMSSMGESNEWVVWGATSSWALAISPLYGSGVSWVSRITNVSGRYAVIFEIGAAIGAVGGFPVAGILFDIDPYTVIHFVSGLIGLLALSFLGMRFTGRRHLIGKRAMKGF